MEWMPTGLAPSRAALLDERGRPDFRDVFGALASRAVRIGTAVTRVRLSTVDLGAPELGGVERFRVVLAELNALRLDAEARGLQADPARAANVSLLRELLASGRLEIRAAPLAGWAPDFTVFSGAAGPGAVLTGFHWFERPYPHRGPALNAVHLGDAARLAARRHDELWEGAHDVGPAVWSILSKAGRRASAVGATSG
jgi:hypothetical protein